MPKHDGEYYNAPDSSQAQDEFSDVFAHMASEAENNVRPLHIQGWFRNEAQESHLTMAGINDYIQAYGFTKFKQIMRDEGYFITPIRRV